MTHRTSFSKILGGVISVRISFLLKHIGYGFNCHNCCRTFSNLTLFYVRLAIARVLYQNPSILILDEATSALDSRSELQVRRALERLMQNRTVSTILFISLAFSASYRLIVIAAA